MKNLFSNFLIIFFGSQLNLAQSNVNKLLEWNFNDSKEIKNTAYKSNSGKENFTKESIRGDKYNIIGLAKYVPGVKGTAIKFDGFSSYIEGVPGFISNDINKDFEFPKEISVEAWISLGAYPWNWAPILTIGKYKITGFYFGVDFRGRVGFHISDGTSIWHECNSDLNPQTKLGIELKKWYHIVGTYNQKKGLSIYINGNLKNTYNDFTFSYGITYSELDKGFRMGMNREMLAPTDPIREWATYPSKYSLDGIVDEVQVYNRCLSPEEIKKIYDSIKPENIANFEPRKFPTVKSSGRFGANYTRLTYYPEWDAIWPFGDFDDIVVQFDGLPIKLMFWRGTRYSPCWVSENGKWMADQSRETGNNWFLSQGPREEMPTGCIEHMSDTQCRSSRVAIIESNDARIVINWKYLQMDVQFRQKNLLNNTGFGEWGNEIYYIYPDGVAVRYVLPGNGGWQETILLNEPGTKPEDNVELTATTLLNMKGESKTYTWENGYPLYDLKDANIQVVNLKSKYKPFIIFREGGGWEVFNLEVRPEYSHFPWWNHWPVSQISSDGRAAYTSDQASHSSLSWGHPNKSTALYGMTEGNPKSLINLARSWNYPPELQLKNKSYKYSGYDYTQRAYMLETINSEENLEFTLRASAESPVYNPAFVIHNWNPKELLMKVNGEGYKYGKDFRYSIVYDVEGAPALIVWIRYESDSPVNFSFEQINKSNN